MWFDVIYARIYIIWYDMCSYVLASGSNYPLALMSENSENRNSFCYIDKSYCAIYLAPSLHVSPSHFPHNYIRSPRCLKFAPVWTAIEIIMLPSNRLHRVSSPVDRPVSPSQASRIVPRDVIVTCTIIAPQAPDVVAWASRCSTISGNDVIATII